MQGSTRGNVRDPACPGRQLFDLVTARWAALVLVDLIEGVVVNTKARTQAYIAAGAFVSGGTFSVSTVADNAASCREAP